MKIFLRLLCALIFMALLVTTTDAQVVKSSALEAVEFLTGFRWAKLKAQKDYQSYPILVDFDFNLKPLAKKFNFNPPQLLQLQIEPYLSVISQPDTNIEGGTSFLFKFGLLPQSSKFQPYLKAGAGIVYLSLHTQEQSTQFNFTEQVGAGMHYFFTKNTALTCEYRYRHLSNAAIKEPNHGINAYSTLVGITYRF